jgi:hypothetical protein
MTSVYSLLLTVRILDRAIKSNNSMTENSFLPRNLPYRIWSMLQLEFNMVFPSFDSHNSGIFAE